MFIRWCFICALLLIKTCSVPPVYPHVTGVIGGSVVLPCASSKNEPHDINVNWRQNDKLKVCDIIKGRYSVEDQDSAFKNRVEVFPEEYRKGNFSVKLHNLTHMDTGEYRCFIPHSSEIVIIQLTVNEAKDKQPPAEEENQGEETKQNGIWIFIPVIVLILFILGILCLWRKGVNTSSSEVSTPTVIKDI